ncbi:MAG: PrgI family protein [Tissierellia bacterium]|nr:PrgI family protein [Tissierellia bacterium]
MRDIKIPKEIKEYEAKIAGGLSIRQLLCVVIGGVVLFTTYLMLKDYLYTLPTILICTLVIIPFGIFGWLRPYGLPINIFLLNFFSYFKRAKKRGYVINNKKLRIFKNLNVNNTKKFIDKEKKFLLRSKNDKN